MFVIFDLNMMTNFPLLKIDEKMQNKLPKKHQQWIHERIY